MNKSRQEVMEFAVAHIIKQGRPAYAIVRGIENVAGVGGVDDVGGCFYRHKLPDGQVVSCHIGCMIKDEDYVDTIEGMAVDAAFRTNCSVSVAQDKVALRKAIQNTLGLIDEDDVIFLQALQSTHDAPARHTMERTEIPGRNNWIPEYRKSVYNFCNAEGLKFPKELFE